MRITVRSYKFKKGHGRVCDCQVENPALSLKECIHDSQSHALTTHFHQLINLESWGNNSEDQRKWLVRIGFSNNILQAQASSDTKPILELVFDIAIFGVL